MARPRLLQQAWRLGQGSVEALLTSNLQRIAAWTPQAIEPLLAASPARLFSGRPASSDAAQQQPQEHASAAATARSSERRRQAPQDRRGEGRSWKPRNMLYIPPAWEQSGERDLDHPLVQQLRAAAAVGNAAVMLQLFEVELAPLKAALAQGQPPAPHDVPPPFAWKLYFAALSTSTSHASRFAGLLDLMQRLGVQPQAACYVIALRQMGRTGLGAQAYGRIYQMKDVGLPPTLRCFMYAIEASLRAQPRPDLQFARRLFDEVAEQGLARAPVQKAELGKLLVQAVRECVRFLQFKNASLLMDHLEGLGLRVPPFLLADVTHMATLAERADVLMECVQRLERATQTFKEVPGVRPAELRPLKVEEGLLLGVLEVAAAQGRVELAEAAWQLLERSVRLPNAPSTPGPLDLRLPQAAAPQAEEEQHSGGGGGQGEASAAETEPQAAGTAAAARGAALEQLSDYVEASAVAAIEAAEARAAHTHRRGQPWSPSSPEPAAAGAAEAEAACGAREPSVLSHLALIHAYAKAGQLQAMFGAVERLVQAHPGDPLAAAYHTGLPMAVDAVARSVQDCDAAFFLLEGWAKEGRHVSAEQLNLVVAGCCQAGDLKRAFETFDSFSSLGASPNTDTYNALMQARAAAGRRWPLHTACPRGCIESGRVDTGLQVFDQMQAAGVEANGHTHHLLVDAGVVQGMCWLRCGVHTTADVPAMMAALEAMLAAGHDPKLALLERCVARAERAGDRGAIERLLDLLFSRDYHIVGVDAKMRRWAPEGGMHMLTGSSKWVNREDVLRRMRKAHTIARRISRREAAAAGGGGAVGSEGALQEQPA